MMQKLPKNLTEFLITQAESGMGYQETKITLKNGKVIMPVAVLNCTYISDDVCDGDVNNIEKIELIN